MPTTTDHIAARDDTDLLQRLIAAAEMAGIPDAESKVRSNLGQLMTVVITGEDEPPQVIADVHAYASLQREAALAAVPPPPGADPAAVTDAHLALAVATLT